MNAATVDETGSELPVGFAGWPKGARRAYLEATLDRDELLELVADRAGLAGASGELTKYQLSAVAVELGGGACE